MLKRLDPRDINITPFKVYKEFTVTNIDSGSGVYGFRAVSSSARNFDPDTATRTTFDSASFYHMPTWFLINKMYYKDTENNFNNFGYSTSRQYRLLQPSASIISVSKDLFGERIKPSSITLTDDSGASTLTIKDDGKGNLYDNDNSSSFAEFSVGGFSNSDIIKSTGSFVGNIFYEQGLLVFTNTGSKYIDIGTKTGNDGYSLKYKAQHTIREHSYTCVIGENEYNGTTNISATPSRSGSISISGSVAWKYFPPGDALYKSGSYREQYNAASEYRGFVTHSEFRPYVTKVGLYNDFNELIAVGQLSHPIKNEDSIQLAINVRFDA